jgi:predicted nucleotide-binding protein
MPDPISDIQQDIANPSVPVVSLLHKAIPFASRLGDKDFVEWASRELKGYTKHDAACDYRQLKGQYIVLGADGRPIPILWQGNGMMNTRFISLPLAEMEPLLSDDSSTYAVKIAVDPQTLESLDVEPGDTIGFSIARATIIGLLNAIRQRVLEWTLTLTRSSAERKDSGDGFMASKPNPAVRAVERLKLLRNELEQMQPQPVDGLKGWITKTKPTIRMNWPDHLSDFEQVTKIPVWQGYPTVYNPSDPVGNQQRSDQYTRDYRQGTARIAAQVKARILQFLEGLLATIEDKVIDDDRTGSSQLHEEVQMKLDDKPDPRRVFVVYGRNSKANTAIFDFLRRLDLIPMEWEAMRAATEKATPFTGEILVRGFQMAQAIVVLMTGDDEARLRDQHHGPDEPEHEVKLTPQPRPNVLIEAGMAFGYNPDRTILVELGKLRPASDFLGRHVIRLNDSPKSRHALVSRLKTAQCAVNDGGADWLDSSISFEAAIS